MGRTIRSAKQAGTRYEREIADFLRESGVFPSAERAPKWGAKDKGDLVNTGPFCIEAKNVKQIDLAGFLAEAEIEAGHAGAQFPAVFIKRRQKPVQHSYVVMDAEDWIEMARWAVEGLRGSTTAAA